VGPDDQAREGINWTMLALIGGLVLVIAVIAYFALRNTANQDKLTNANIAASAPQSREKLCARQATYDLIKADLFRRAAQLRGSDQTAYDRLSNFAVVRMENPVMESEDSTTGAVHCSGSLSLDLPPGVAVVGGRRTLTADVDYTVEQAADGSGTVVLLQNADAIISPLTTLVRVAQPAPEPTTPVEENGVAPQAPGGNEVQPQPTTPQPPPQPSFRRDAGLVALDRAMTVEYARASAVATPEQRELLRQTAIPFYAYRDRCRDRQCIADAYAGRTREIRDIIEGR
jgi:hypothetical protein